MKINLIQYWVNSLYVKVLYLKRANWQATAMNNDHVDMILDQWRQAMPELDPSPMAVIGRMGRISKLMSDEVVQRLTTFDLNMGEFDVLATLRRSGEPYRLTPGQLLQTLMLTSGAMTNRLDKLEQRELIQRQPDPDDRRAVQVQLTDSGLELINRAVVAHVENENRMLTALTDTEQQQLADLLKKLLLARDA